MSGMGFPNDPTFYGEDLPLVPRTIPTTAQEEEQSFLAEMMSDYIEDLQRTAARTSGINRKFFLTVAEKLA